MDVFLVTSPSRREKYRGMQIGDGEEAEETPAQFRTRVAVLVVLGVWAAYLSWTTNTRLGYTIPTKILCALSAALFGGLYLIFFYIMRSDCQPR